MTRLHMLAATLLGLMAWAAAVSPAQGYYVESHTNEDAGATAPMTYDASSPVKFRIGPTPSEAHTEALASAFQSWEGVECSQLAFERGEPVTDPDWLHWEVSAENRDRYILIFFTDDPAMWQDARVGLFLFAQDGFGEMIGASIALNSKDHDWSTTGEEGTLDVQSVATALVGRSLGITATAEGNATYPRYLPGDTSKRELGSEDTAALQYLYGDGSCDPESPEGMCTRESSEPCPPPVETNPDDGTSSGGDAGSGTATADAGTGSESAASDAGMALADGGPSGSGADMGGGGGCSLGGRASTNGAFAVLLVAAILLGARRRRARPRAR
jgi:hypothetical protein